MMLTGPSGRLDADYQAADEPTGCQAVLCHPHPQYGGNRHDGVLDVLARALHAHGVGVLRFDFRGVGASEGVFDGHGGEVDDLLAAASWLQVEHPGPLWLGGYSFGAHVAWQAQTRGLNAPRLLLIAPPLGPMQFDIHHDPGLVDVFAGSRDSFIDADLLGAWSGVRVHTLPGADHFFSGQTRALERAINAALN